MSPKSLLATCIVATSMLGVAASAATVNFDDAYAANVPVGNYYAATHGLTVSGTFFGLVGGNGNGDPGNWNLEGTNGSAFLGCNQNTSCSPTFTFANPLASLSLDLGMPGFAWSGDFTVTALLGNTVVDSVLLNISSPSQNAGNWQTATVTGLFDSVTVSFAGIGGAFGYGLDNVVFEASNGRVPEPGMPVLVAGALLGLMVARRRKAK